MGSITEQAKNIPIYPSYLPVQNVQEMVSKDPLLVPQRYIRSEEEMKTKIDLSHLSSQIPVIDLSLLSKRNKEELTKLDLACQQWGFFQVVNHGVTSEMLQAMKDTSAEFFQLPLEEKNKISMQGNGIQGYGHAYVVDEDQILDWTDSLMMRVYPTWLRNNKIWPTQPQGYKECIEEYTTEMRRVAEELLGSLSLVLGMERGSLLEMHKELGQGFRVNYYPPCHMPDKVLGLSPHSDTSTITILMQDDDVIGLQIRHKEGWVPIEPIPNSLIVNVGDVIEILSNGKYKSIEHRAVTNKNKARFSYAVFVGPQLEVELEPLSHIIESQGSLPKYKKVQYGDYVRQSTLKKMEGEAHTQVAKTGK